MITTKDRTNEIISIEHFLKLLGFEKNVNIEYDPIEKTISISVDNFYHLLGTLVEKINSLEYDNRINKKIIE